MKRLAGDISSNAIRHREAVIGSVDDGFRSRAAVTDSVDMESKVFERAMVLSLQG